MAKLAIHLAMAALLYLALLILFPSNFSPSIQTLAIMLFAAAFPDIDHHNTKIFKTTLATAAFTFAVFAYIALQNTLPFPQLAIASLAAAVLAVIAVRALKPRHRGITHSLAAAFFFGAVAFFATGGTLPLPFSPELQAKGIQGILSIPQVQTALATTAAYLSHLTMDREIKIM